MKKLILFLLTLSTCATIFAQETVLLETEWITQNLIIDGEDHIPSNTGANFKLNIYYSESDDIYTLFFMSALTMPSTEITFTMGEQEFITNNNWVSLTDGICSSNTTPCGIFGNMLNEFYMGVNSTPISKTFDYELGIDENDNPTLVITDANGDQAIYGTESVLNITNFSENSFKLYPNPATETLFITSKNNLIEKIAVYSIKGQLALSEKENVNQLNVSSLSNGLYFVEITSENGTAIQKFVKQ